MILKSVMLSLSKHDQTIKSLSPFLPARSRFGGGRRQAQDDI